VSPTCKLSCRFPSVLIPGRSCPTFNRTMVSNSPLFLLSVLCLLQVALSSESYESFRQTHGRVFLAADDEISYQARSNLFRQRKTEVSLHNSHNMSWKVAMNKYSDFTDAELNRMLGYKRVGGRWAAGGRSSPAGGSSFIQEHEYATEASDKLASAVDWRNNLAKSSSWVRNQGACGSCWAVAATGALEMHAEQAHGSVKRLSHQQLVDCVQNPRHCGGTGGCKGATGELAFEYSHKNGISTEDAYKSGEGGTCNTNAPSALSVGKFVRLPENKGSFLKEALANKGPVVVSVDGGSWFSYASGVFSGCEKDTVVNHAVLALGYGKDQASQKDYWTIRNSWGPEWGEEGFMRLQRHTNDNDYCGTDNNPKDGVFCDDAPASVTVCGMCGITSDSSYPNIHPQKHLRSTVSHHRADLDSGVL